ncbi:MAG: hypothetical protein MK116_01135 [Phycisphaerales bacterium]|nr:hypothetical protein [Phycisphaerales bacterium]
MTSPGNTTALIDAASANWDRIAEFAWKSYRLGGPGAVLVLGEDLLRAGLEAGPGGESSPAEGGLLPMNYFAREDIPPGDDFRSLMDTYDPETQVVLMVGSPEGEQVLVLEARDGGRRPPRSFQPDQ